MCFHFSQPGRRPGLLLTRVPGQTATGKWGSSTVFAPRCGAQSWRTNHTRVTRPVWASPDAPEPTTPGRIVSKGRSPSLLWSASLYVLSSSASPVSSWSLESAPPPRPPHDASSSGLLAVQTALSLCLVLPTGHLPFAFAVPPWGRQDG